MSKKEAKENKRLHLWVAIEEEEKEEEEEDDDDDDDDDIDEKEKEKFIYHREISWSEWITIWN